MIKYSISSEIELLAKEVVDCGFQVHKALGPGLLESAYQACLEHELQLRTINFRSQVSLPVVYKDIKIDAGYRLDIMIEDKIILELKAVEKMNPLYDAQLEIVEKLSTHHSNESWNPAVKHKLDSSFRWSDEIRVIICTLETFSTVSTYNLSENDRHPAWLPDELQCHILQRWNQTSYLQINLRPFVPSC